MAASILTNTSAMVALANLRSTNSSLEQVNSQISTGKKVATAKDSAAVFAISKIMESDVAGFKALNESLSLGESTVAVASNAAASVGELLNEIKGKIVSANEENVDRTKLQDEIVSLRNQITSIVDSAQFNGLNLLNGNNDGAGGFSVLASLNRASDGSVTTGSISFDPTNSNLSTSSGTTLTIGDAATGSVVTGNVFNVADITAGTTTTHTNGDVDANGVYNVTLDANLATAGDDGVTLGDFDFQTTAANTGGATAVASDNAFDTTGTGGLIAGDSISVTVGAYSARYTIVEGDSQADISAGLRAGLLDNGLDTDSISATVNADGELQIRNLTNATDVDVSISSSRAAGGLAGLDALDVSTSAGATSALGEIEVFIDSAVDAQAELGTIEKRLDIQNEFTTTLIDSFKSGIGALVDADLEEASARLQALQVQQQLGIQALSIANQAPQNILALFR
ncbi:MAG: flagellin [Pseudomonadota bacterium]